MSPLLLRLIPSVLLPILGLVASPPRGQRLPEAAAWVSLTSDAEGGLVEEGETVTFTASVRNSSRAPLVATLEWELITLAFDSPDLEPLRIEVPERETETFKLAVPMDGPGFVEAEVSMLAEGARKLQHGRGRPGLAVKLSLREARWAYRVLRHTCEALKVLDRSFGGA